jgi:Rrf2 family nitric oxide-sensitive transcriptional repressor
MHLTSHTDYSLRLLIYLALKPDHGQATVQEVATRYGISSNHVAKVAQKLVQLGYVVSHRGRGGGLALALAPEEINVGQVVRGTEPLELLECFGANSTCPIDPSCRLKGVLHEAQRAFLEVIDRYTLADLVGSHRVELERLLAIE